MPRDQVLDRLGGRGFARELDDVDAFGRLRDRGAALAPDPVAAEVQRDAIEPGREFRLPLEPLERAERAEEGLLRRRPAHLLPGR